MSQQPVPGSNPGSDTISARVTLDKLLTHIVSLPRFDGHSSTHGALTNGIFFRWKEEALKVAVPAAAVGYDPETEKQRLAFETLRHGTCCLKEITTIR